MKLTMPRDVLAAMTAWATAAADTGIEGATSPVLAGIMLTAADGTLTAARFGYSASATASAAAETGEPGRVLVSARMLTQVTAALPARQPVDVAFDGTRVTLAAGAARYVLMALPPEEYPALPEPGDPAAEFDPRALATAVATAAVATADASQKLPALTCVRVELDGKGTATLHATDRYRLAVTTCPYVPLGAAGPVTALIPARELAAAVKRPGTAPVRLAITPGTASVASDGRHVTIRQLAAEWPNVTKLIPAAKDITTTAVADVAALAAAVKRAAVVAERNTPARFGFTRPDGDGTAEVRVESGTGDEAQLAETVPLTLDGGPLGIALNPGYLLDALAAVTATGSPTARIAMTTPTTPAIITPAEPDSPGGCTYVLMPIRSAG